MKHKHVDFLFCGILVLFFIATPIFSQTNTLANPSKEQLDSLAQYYTLSKTDSLSIPERLQNVDRFLKGVTLYQQDSLRYKGLVRKTWLFGIAKEYDSAIVYTHQLYDLAAQNQDSMYIAKAYNKLGIYHKRNNQLAEAFYYYNEAVKIVRIDKDTLRIGRILLSMANIQTSLGDYSGSKITAIDGVKYIEHTSDLRSLSGLYHIISVAYKQQQNITEAIKYNTKALALGKDSVSMHTIGIKNILIFKNTTALILADQGDYKRSINLLKALVSNPIVQQDTEEYPRVLGNLGYVQWLENKDNKNSEVRLLEAADMWKKIDDTKGLILNNISLSKYYLDRDTAKALHYAESAYYNAKRQRSLVSTLEALGLIFQLKENVSVEARVYDQIHHKIQEINQKNQEVYAVTKYENEKLTNQNVVLQAEKNKMATRGIIVSLLLIISVSGVIYYYYKQYLYKKRFLQLRHTTQQYATPAVSVLKDKTGLSVISEEALEHLLTELQKFEEKQEYLTPNINAKDLAKSFGSNSSYLSMVVNTYKQKSISQYINDLRIDFAIDKLQSDPIFRKYTIKAVAQEVGFNSSEIFAKKFYKKTGIYPSYFIKKLEGAEV